MTQVDAAKQNQLAIKNYINGEAAMKKMQELIGKNAASFSTSIMQIVNSNKLLQKATPQSIFNAACMAATLNLPINNNLGFAYIVPFNNSKTGTTEAQLQLGYKGFIQLAQRSGQFKRINACPVYEQDTEEDVHKRLTSLIPTKPQGRMIGYIAYFQLLNGYEANLTMSMDELEAHAKKYSQTYKSGYGVWADNFEAMARKTVIKLLLSQQAPLSIEMQQAVLADQAVVKDVTAQEFEYIDNQPTPPSVSIDVDDELFDKIKQSIARGEITVVEALNGNYNFTEEQERELDGDF